MRYLKSIALSLTLLFLFTQVEAQVKTTGSATEPVMTAYFGLKNALTADDAAGAKTSAKELVTAINGVKPASLSPAQQKVWAANLAKLQFDSRHISESPAIEHQREHFASLSKTMAVVVKGLKSNSAVVYEQYCPMKKASWLSESADVKNPYYGKKMLTCGEVKETFAANVK